MGFHWADGYSSTVEVFLEIDGERYRVERVGKGTFVLRDPCECPPGTAAKLIVGVDGVEKQLDIVLSHGAGQGIREAVPFS
ncbi:MAG: hypothetical protein HYX69_07335 [Planctomycetia bacterium]|nr:hypothetical protein [Planctomycetia bacterium]